MRVSDLITVLEMVEPSMDVRFYYDGAPRTNPDSAYVGKISSKGKNFKPVEIDGLVIGKFDDMYTEIKRENFLMKRGKISESNS